jgi:hypothetical protein
LAPTGDIDKDKRAKKRYGALIDPPKKWLHQYLLFRYDRLEEEIARMKKNQERRLHRKNAKIVKEGGIPMQLNRPVKPDTTVSHIFNYPSACILPAELSSATMWPLWTNGSYEYEHFHITVIVADIFFSRNQPKMSSLGRIQQRCSPSYAVRVWPDPAAWCQSAEPGF